MKKLIICLFALLSLAASAQQSGRKVVDGGGSGPFKAEAVSDPTLPGFVVYRPQDIAAAVAHDGPMPLFVFANGGCSDTSLAYERMLTDLASYGYVAVALGEMQMADGDRQVGTAPNSGMIEAIDWAVSQNADPASPYHNAIDTEYIALGGHSCGGAQTVANAADPRVATYVMLNSGMGDMHMADASTESLLTLHGPILYIEGGESDMAYANGLIDYERIGHVPVAFANHATIGHGGTYHQEYGGDFARMLRLWLSWQFKGARNNLSFFVEGRFPDILQDKDDWTIKSKNFFPGQQLAETSATERRGWQRPEFDPAYPDVHDPVMAYEDGRYYMFTTGIGIGMLSSADMVNWRQEAAPLNPIPQWAQQAVPAYRGHTWAPDVIKVGDHWYLYYSCSTFGKNISAIGVLTSPALDSARAQWTDLGMVVQSVPGKTDWNAIDPNVIIADGQPWMVYGSFWDGIQLMPLAADMRTPAGEPRTVARRRCPCTVAHMQEHANTNAIEAPFIHKHGDYYYLFVSYDYCCQGLASNYKTAVGRSLTIDGPYLDKDGNDLADTGGTVIIADTEQYVGVGHCSVYDFDGTTYFIAHAYDKDRHGASKLFVSPVDWVDGWPVIRHTDGLASHEPLPIGEFTSPKMLTDDNNPLIDHMFTADPTSVEHDGRLYVYGTNDHEQYLKAEKNGYEQIKSLVMISTDDMANWTYHGTIPVGEIEPYIVNSWAPTIEKKVMDDGQERYFLYFSNSGTGVGVITAPSPVGPWTDPIGRPLIDSNTPTLGDSPNPFDPGVVIDADGVGWLAFGAGINATGSEAMPGSARIVRLAPDMVSLASDIAEIPAPYLFEASELNYIDSTYVYTYNTSWGPRDVWPYDAPAPSMCSMAYMTSKTPLDPKSWVYQHHYMPNPGETVEPYTNNHTHLAKYADRWYLLCHSMYLQDSYGTQGGFRNMSVEDIEVDEHGPSIGMTAASRHGVSQIHPLNPRQWVSAATVAATHNPNFVEGDSVGHMIVRSQPDRTGVYRVKGVAIDGERSMLARVRGKGQIDVYADSVSSRPVASKQIATGDGWQEVEMHFDTPAAGSHDLYIAIGGGDIDLDSWQLR